MTTTTEKTGTTLDDRTAAYVIMFRMGVIGALGPDNPGLGMEVLGPDSEKELPMESINSTAGSEIDEMRMIGNEVGAAIRRRPGSSEARRELIEGLCDVMRQAAEEAGTLGPREACAVARARARARLPAGR